MKKPISWVRRRRNIVVLLLILVGLAPAYLHAFSISGGGVSEAPTILAGDTVIVNQAAYTIRLPYTNLKLLHVGSPQRSTMVVILVPPKGVPAPKRIVGIPGDTVEIRDHLVVVNGRPLPLEKLDPTDFRWVPDSNRVGTSIEKEDGHWITRTIGAGKYRDHGPVRLGDGQYFAIGDNRDMSLDSRAFGPITDAQIVGQVIAVIRTGPRR
jgi:signal peptidase I